jgi:hypothetical protein
MLRMEGFLLERIEGVDQDLVELNENNSSRKEEKK